MAEQASAATRRAPRSGRGDLAIGPIRPQLTSTGATFALGMAAAVFFGLSNDQAVVFGPIIALAILGLADLVRSRQLLKQASVEVACVKRRAAAPDGVKYTVTGTPGVAIELRRLGQPGLHDPQYLDGNRITVDPGPAQVSNQTSIEYRISRSVIGLVAARRTVVQLVPFRIVQAPEAWEGTVDPLPSGRLAELERVREYTAGDRRNRISWPTTARTGVLHVRDDLMVNDQVAVIVVDTGQPTLTLDSSAMLITRAASMARLCAERAWAEGYEVRMISWHDTDVSLRLTSLARAKSLDPAFELKVPLGARAVALHDDTVDDMDQLIDRLGGLAFGGAPVPRPPPPFLHVTPKGVWKAE